jgi:hypothetical protein
LEYFSNFQQLDAIQVETRSVLLNGAFIIAVKEKRKQEKGKE